MGPKCTTCCTADEEKKNEENYEHPKLQGGKNFRGHKIMVEFVNTEPETPEGLTVDLDKVVVL